MNKRFLILSIAAGIGATLSAALADITLPAATQTVLQTYPGTRIHTDQGRVRIIYGAPMTAGVSAEAAAAEWLLQHGEALGAPEPDLRLKWSATIEDGKFTVFAFQQFLDDLPVEYGIARILVLNRPFPRVVYAAGTLAPATALDLMPAQLDGETAVALVRAQRLYNALPVWSDPEPGVYQGNGDWHAPVRVWHFLGEDPDLVNRKKLRFFVDAATGNVVEIRNEVLHDNDIVGSTRAMATPGDRPDLPNNQPTLQNLGEVRLTVFNGTSDFSQADGTFILPHIGIEPVRVTTRLGPSTLAGRWVYITDARPNTPVLQFQTNVTPPGPANFVFNSAPNGGNTAQVNAFIVTNKIHNFFRDRSGTWGLIDHALRATVNIDDTCNAFYDGSSINFFAAGGGCTNSAFSTVIAHEYGHHIVNQLGLGQGGFGEGFSDACGHLLFDTDTVGRDFGPNMSRAPLTSNIQYECDDGIHTCGMILSGVWWRIRQNMGAAYGSQEGLERTQQMFVSWALITVGGTGPAFRNSAHPGTAIEILTIDDDDGDLSNGTPHLIRICPAFPPHSLVCPGVSAIKWVFPNGIPERLNPDQANTVDVTAQPMGAIPVNGTGRIRYRIDGGAWVQANMALLGSNQYRATIPAQSCGTLVDYYFTVNLVGGGMASYPALAPQRTLFGPVAQSLTTIFSDDFEGDQGWVGEVEDDDATTGRWTRGLPQATPAQPGQNRTPAGNLCWVTDYRAGAQVSDYDVDNGKTTLLSPIINLNNRTAPVVSFWVWYSNNVGPVNPGTNLFTVDVTPDDGGSWHRALTLGPDTEESRGGWRYYRFRLEDFIPATANFRIRFVAADYTHSIVEAAVDDFMIQSLNCGPSPSQGCYANCDGSTTEPILNVEDFTCFINRFAAGDPWANCDGSTTEPVLNVEDFTCFINQFVQGCR
jgi:Zn-dependent metalloprotease